MQRFPGIAVTVSGGPSNVHSAEIDKQTRRRVRCASIMAMLQTVQDFERWKQAGALTPFKPDGFDKIDDGWKDRDGAYVGVTSTALSYAYNPQKAEARGRTAHPRSISPSPNSRARSSRPIRTSMT